MDLTPTNLQALFTAYNTAFQQGRTELGPKADVYKQFAMVVPSSTAQNVYPWMGDLPKLREWLGDRVVHGLKAADFTIKNRKFELTHGVDRDTIDDDSYGVYTPLFNEYGRSSAEHPNELCVEVFTANPLCFDGQPLFDADHPVLDENGDEVSVSNDMGGSGPAWYVMDLSRMIKPVIFQERRAYDFRALTNLQSDQVFMTDQFKFGVDGRVSGGAGLWQLVVRSQEDLTAANYEAARKRLQGLQGDYGRPLALRHTHTMFPTDLEGAIRKILNSEHAAGGETNEWKDTSAMLMNHWLPQS